MDIACFSGSCSYQLEIYHIFSMGAGSLVRNESEAICSLLFHFVLQQSNGFCSDLWETA